MYAISRLQVQPSGTWCWSVNFSRAGKSCARRFYDPKYGGSRAAKRAAVAWRDAQLAEVKAMGILDFAQLLRANNSSGMPGVTFSKSARQPEGFWQARLKLDGGATRTASFSRWQSRRGAACWPRPRIGRSCTMQSQGRQRQLAVELNSRVVAGSLHLAGAEVAAGSRG
jgi:hypothetical protein